MDEPNPPDSLPVHTEAEAVSRELPPGRPSRGWYGLAFVLFLVGLGAFVASINVAKGHVAAAQASLQKFVAPGSTTLDFDEAGQYFVYYEKVGEFNGESFDTTQHFTEMPKLSMRLVDQATGETLPVAKSHDTQTHMYGHGRANSEFVLDIPAPGRYTLTAQHANELDVRLLLAVGPPMVTGLTSDWFGPFGGASLFAFACVVSAVVTLVTWMLRRGYVTRRED